MDNEFNNFDQILAEALSSDAVPSPDFSQRLMERVYNTPQDTKISRFPRKYISAIAACLVIALISIPVLKQTLPFGMSAKSATGFSAPALAAPASLAPAEIPAAEDIKESALESMPVGEEETTSCITNDIDSLSLDQTTNDQNAKKEAEEEHKSASASLNRIQEDTFVVDSETLSQALYQAFQEHDILPDCIDEGIAVYSLSESIQEIIMSISPELCLENYNTIELTGIST